MRWPLRNQILLPVSGLMVVTLVGVSAVNAWNSAREARRRIERDVNQLATSLATANFPLTDTVLERIRGLSGAEFLVTDATGSLVATSSPRDHFTGWRPDSQVAAMGLALGNPRQVGDSSYFQASLPVRPSAGLNAPTRLHILYPVDRYDQAWRDAVYPPAAIGIVALLLVVLSGIGIASRVTRPLHRLRTQVDEIAGGDFQLLPIPSRDDEISDLSRAVNRMAEMLAGFERDVRRNEQLRTLGQLGAGIAHQLRNAATGCRLAIDLHSRECPQADQDESLHVAMRQLQLMEQYLRRFMALGKGEEAERLPVDLAATVANVVELVQPTARHLEVELKWTLPDASCIVIGDGDALEQLLVNLTVNAIEAVAEHPTGFSPESPQDASRTARDVHIALQRCGDVVTMIVSDSGPGPQLPDSAALFDPFVSEKRDGTGLGLTVAKQIVGQHRGTIGWQRMGGRTVFSVTLPVASEQAGERSGGLVSQQV